MGWTWLSVPRCNATIWRGTVATMQASPRSHTPRLSACVSRLSFSVSDAGAFSIPMRWSTLASALASAHAVARR